MLQPQSVLAVERPTNIINHRETYYKDLSVSDMSVFGRVGLIGSVGPMDWCGPKPKSTSEWDLVHRLMVVVLLGAVSGT